MTETATTHRGRLRFERYGVAFGLCLLAFPIARTVGAPSACFILAVMACSLYLGRGPALFATLMNSLLFTLFFLPPGLVGYQARASLVRVGITIAAMLLTTEMIERKRKSDRMRLQVVEDFRLITQTSPDCILSMSRDGRILFGNPAATDLFGYADEEVEGVGLSLLLPGLERGQTPAGELRAQRKDGSTFTVEATCGSFGDKITVFLRDISDRKRTEDSLRWTQAKLAKAAQIATVAEFSASIAHEISQPISAMVANGQASLRWLKADGADLSDAFAAMERVVRDGKDAKGIIDRLRALYRRSGLEKAPLDLAVVCREVVSLARGRAEREHIVLETDIVDHLPLIEGDRIQLQQVLLNLITNGMDAMQEVEGRPKRLLIRVVGGEDCVLTEVHDSGVGVQEFEGIFDSFVTTKEQGLGMGLSICRSIVEAHGGCIWAAPGQESGSIFSFTIPASGGESSGT